MCTVVILRRPEHDWPLLIAANRDEMLARSWLPPARHWPDRPDVVAGFDDEEGTVKHFQRDGSTIVLVPSNPDYSEIRRSADEVTIYGRVVTVLRKI